MSYPVVRTDNMAGTTDPALLRTAKFYNGTAYAAINNGTVLKLDSILTSGTHSGRETWKAVTPAATSSLDDIILVSTPELLADERKKNLDDFQNPADGLLRGYHLRKNDIFAVSSDGFTVAAGVTVAAGKIVELQAATTMQIVSSLTANSTKVGEVIAVETVGSKTYYVVRVC